MREINIKKNSDRKTSMRVVRKIKVADGEVRADVPPERAFWLHNGPAVKNLKELHDAVKDMLPEQFEYHTIRNGNDFARWIRDVLLEPECASKVETAKGQKETLKVLVKYL